MMTHAKAIVLFMTILLLPCTVFSDGLSPREKLCPQGDCRGPITIRLVKEDGSIFEQSHDYLYPVIQSMGITIFPGEQIKITGSFKDNKLTDTRVLGASDHDPPLITFNFSQETDKSMLLTVTNHSANDIKYHLAMMPLASERLVKTSSCPVSAGLMAFESWPFPIYQLLVPEIFIVEKSDQSKCEY